MYEAIREFLSRLHTAEGLQSILTNAGPYVVALLTAIVFAETGLLVGFFLPGDSLLIAAGVVSAKGAFNPWLGAGLMTLAAVVGDQLGYYLGRRAGRAVFSRGDGRIIKRRYFDEAHDYFLKNGPKSLVLARFVPILRTFVPFVAGVAEMPYRKFVYWSIAGGCLWVWTLTAIGYALGSGPWVKHLHHILIVVVAVSALPVVFGVLKRFLRDKKG